MRLRIVEFPDPVLRKPTKPVTDFGPDLKTFVDEMTIVMKDDDGVGIAAPQVGVSKKIAVVCIEGTRYVLVNPRIVSMEGEQGGEEGCLSFPGIFGEIKRAARVVVECQDETGAPRRYEAGKGRSKLEGCLFTIDTETGRCLAAEGVRLT